MLELKDIVKTYGEGENMVTALQGVSMSFRESEFAAILGHSGCGKTTLLNIIGGLDHYTSGDLVINGVSTKKYRDKDWDSYRNHSIGFIFQSYNLIPHQNVLSNVELALTVSGVSKAERRRRAVEALEKVGLGDQLNKRPNQMSGGQMQRVAIARALVNDPDILLADEPTGALDTENSIQIMEILKEIARTKLVIMVTHNPELAKDYATRIIRISDGKLTSDSDPYTPEKEQAAEKPKKNVSMSFFTAISLSLNNLMTKKGRTFLTAFAGSIGIIGIALILSLSTGINDYINQIQQETLSSYPITINSETTDTSELMAAFLTEEEKNEQSTQQKMFSNTSSMEMFNSYNSSATRKNNLKDFKTFLDTDKGVQDNVTAIKYYYDTGMNLYTEDTQGRVIKCDITDIYAKAWGVNMSSSMSMMTGSISSFGDFQLFTQLISNADGTLSDIEKNRYELVYGSWPEKADEVVLILSQNNEIPDLVLYSLGYKDSTKAAEVLSDIVKGNIVEDYGRTEWTYEEAVGKTFKAVLPFEKYSKGTTGNYVDLTATDEGLDFLYNSNDVGTTLHISGIIRPLDGQNGMSSAYLAYSYALTEEMMNKLSDSELVKVAEKSRDINIISGLPFYTDDYTEPDNAEKAQRLKEYLDTADEEHRAEIFRFLVTEAEAAEETDIEEEPVVFTREEMEAAMIAAYSEQSGMDADTVAGYIKAMDDETLMQYFDEMAVQADVPVADEDVDEIPDDVMAAYDANGQYLCELSVEYVQADIGACTIHLGDPFMDVAYAEFSGEPVELPLFITFEGMQVTDADYNVSYIGNDAEGTATVTITGKNAFNGEVKKTFTVIDTRVAAPEITGIQNKENGISLSWSEAAGASGYSVYRNGEKIADTDAAALSFEDTDVSSGETYTYTVCAFRNAENGQTYESEPSGEKTIVYLASPVIASVVNAASASTVTWSEVTGADGYRLYRKTGSGEFEQAAEIAGGSTVKYADKAAKTSGTKYTYYVTAYKTVGEGEEAETFTSADSAQKVSYFVARPAISSIANAATGTTVSWKKITGATGYYLYRKTGSGSYSPAATITSGSTVKYTDTKAKTNGTKYTYYVVAYKTVGKATYKSANSAAKISYFLTRPAISSASNTAAKTMTVKWKKNAKATGYQVKYVTGSTSKTVTITKNTTLSRVIKSLVKGKAYKVYLRSYKKVSGVNYYSAWSAAKSVKITK